MAVLIDTGVLLRTADIDDPQHTLVSEALAKLIRGGTHVVTSIQHVAEFWNVATRPRSGNGLALATAEAQSLLDRAITTQVAVVREGRSTFDVFLNLLVTHQVVGKQVHDTRLVATALTNGVNTILTLNPRDFQRFAPEGIRVLAPADVLAG